MDSMASKIKSDVFEIQDETTWEEKVDNAPGLTFVEFFVDWCPHCQREAPTLDSVLDQIEAAGVHVYRASAETMWTKGQVYGLEETPSFILCKDGKMVKKHEGFLTTEELVEFATTE